MPAQMSRMAQPHSRARTAHAAATTGGNEHHHTIVRQAGTVAMAIALVSEAQLPQGNARPHSYKEHRCTAKPSTRWHTHGNVCHDTAKLAEEYSWHNENMKTIKQEGHTHAASVLESTEQYRRCIALHHRRVGPTDGSNQHITSHDSTQAGATHPCRPKGTPLVAPCTTAGEQQGPANGWARAGNGHNYTRGKLAGWHNWHHHHIHARSLHSYRKHG